MKVEYTTYNPKYIGLICGFSAEPVITLGKKTITTGFLFNKKVVSEDVWFIKWSSEHMSSNGMSVDIDLFWTTIKVFPYDQKEEALQFLEDLKETL